MSKNEQQSSSYEMTSSETDLIHWNRFKIDFRREAQKFPDNKIYTTIKIDPDADRRLIHNFTLLVNNHNHGEITADCQYISIAGFDITRNASVHIKIRANPINKNLKEIKKESQTCVCSFTNEIISFSPIIKFIRGEECPEPITMIKWHFIDDPFIRTYDMTIDEDPIKHFKQDTSNKQIETFIYGLTPGREYKFQILAKLKNGTVKYKSDLIQFTVPFEEDIKEEGGEEGEEEQSIDEVLQIQSEKIPEVIRDFTIIEEDKTQFRQNALDLLNVLKKQIEHRQTKLK